MKMRWFIAACLGLLVTAALVGAQPRTPEGEHAQLRVQRNDAIAIKGHIDALFPGQSTYIRLRLHNRARSAMVVETIKASVGDASAQCPSENLTTWKRRLERRIPPRSVRYARLRIELSAAAVDACQGAKFPLKYRAKARR